MILEKNLLKHEQFKILQKGFLIFKNKKTLEVQIEITGWFKYSLQNQDFPVLERNKQGSPNYKNRAL